jgi:N-acetylneuraminate synthase/sialic acid synthase
MRELTINVRELTINGTRIADDAPCYVIGEIGHNHGGSVDRAFDIMEAMAAAGVSAVKFQRRTNRAIYTRELLQRPYEHEHSYGPTYGAHRDALELSKSQLQDVFDQAAALRLTAFATAFDEQAADDLAALGVPAIKIASGDLTNTPFLRHVAQLKLPLILSTGGGTMDDITRAVNTITAYTHQLAILHCTAAYPVHDHAELNLRVIPALRTRFPDYVIGWSGHDTGIAMPVMAYSLGARIIEKHVTCNRTWKGTDQAFSLEPGGVRRMVRDLERVRVALGDGIKRVYPSEVKPLEKMRKSLVAAKTLRAGQVIQRGDLLRKSPNTGIPAYELDTVVGFTLARDLAADEPLTYAHLEGGLHAAAS